MASAARGSRAALYAAGVVGVALVALSAVAIPFTRAAEPEHLATVVEAVEYPVLAIPGPQPADVEPYVGPRGAPRLAVIGDSITGLSREALHQSLRTRYRVSVDGRPGYTFGQQLPVARVYAGAAPSIVAINLGTNDVGYEIDAGEAAGDFTEMLHLFPSARCIVVVTVNANTLDPARNERARALNFVALFGTAQQDARIRLADWNALVHAYYAAGQPEGDLTSDLIHPTEVGQRKLADLVRSTTATCPA